MKKSVTDSSIELIVDYAFLPVGEDFQEAVLMGSSYLRNTSSDTVYVVTGPALGPVVSPGKMRYILNIETTNIGGSVKPSPGAVDIVELRPGEIAALKKFNQPVKKGIDIEVQVTYSVDRGLRKYYPEAWVGILGLVIDTRPEANPTSQPVK